MGFNSGFKRLNIIIYRTLRSFFLVQLISLPYDTVGVLGAKTENSHDLDLDLD